MRGGQENGHETRKMGQWGKGENRGRSGKETVPVCIFYIRMKEINKYRIILQKVDEEKTGEKGDGSRRKNNSSQGNI